MLPDLRQIFNLLAWLLAISQLVFGLYIIFLNRGRPANRLAVGGTFGLVAVNSYAFALLLGADDVSVALHATYVLAATSPMLGWAFLSDALILLRPRWYAKRLALWVGILIGLFALPVLLTFVDVVWGTNLWYSGLDVDTYKVGSVTLMMYTRGYFSPVIHGVFGYLPLGLFLIGVLWLGHVRPHPDFPRSHYWVWPFLLVQVLATAMYFVSSALSAPIVVPLVFNGLCVGTYAIAFFTPALLGHSMQRGSLRTRLTILIFVIAVPISVFGVMLVGYQAVGMVEESETRRLAARNDALATSINVWLNIHVNALAEVAKQPAIVTMDPEQQGPVLKLMDDIYSSVYLVSTTDLTGMNVARSDMKEPTYYGDRQWFLNARAGVSPALEIVLGRTSGVPALVGAMPITQTDQTIVGIVMFASTLSDVAAQVKTTEIGESGFAYIVDQEDQILAHSDPEVTAHVTDFSAYPPVMQLRANVEGLVKFRDNSGQRWWAYVRSAGPGLGVIVQQREEEVLRGTRQFQLVYWAVTLVGALLLTTLGFMAVRQAFRPILTLTETAQAIVQGDLARLAPVESEDEIGTLAQTFNLMTAQLRTLIETLEERVAERTRALERRAEYLAVTARVSRVTSSILDVDTLLTRVANLISERFGFYHAAIFLIDDSGEWAVLRTVSSEDGKRMLARGHRLRVGEQGIVG